MKKKNQLKIIFTTPTNVKLADSKQSTDEKPICNTGILRGSSLEKYFKLAAHERISVGTTPTLHLSSGRCSN